MYGYTAAMMRLRPDGRELEANKSWFLFDGEVVALGSGIRSTAEGKTVETIVENRLIRGTPEFTPRRGRQLGSPGGHGDRLLLPAARGWQA